MIDSKILELIIEKDISFAIINGKYDIESYNMEVEDFLPDFDVVLQSNPELIIEDIRNSKDFQSLGQFSFREKDTNIRVDLYFHSLNVGYYHFLCIEERSFINNRVSEEEYIVYQLLDPLLKFSRYLPRHKYRLQKYFVDGVPDNIICRLEAIIGRNLTKRLLNKILTGDFDVSQFFIRRCKIKILFINGNFVKMIRKRILK